MKELTLDGLTAILRECAGEDEGTALRGDILDAAFEELGYDSIALLETVGRIQADYGVALSDDLVVEATTPRDMLVLVNRTLSEAV